MDYKAKKDEYRVQIRKKKINQKITNFRRQIFIELQMQDLKQVKEDLSNVFKTNQISHVIQKLPLLKKYSQNIQIVAQLKHSFQILYKIVIGVDELESKAPNKQEIFADAITILINITSFECIDFKHKISEDIATPLTRNFFNTTRQIHTIWLMANILYRHNSFSTYLVNFIARSQLQLYIKNRMNRPFNSQTDLTIFNYFIGAVLSCMGQCQVFADYKCLVAIAENLSEFDNQQCYWYLLQGLSQHAWTFNKFNYQIWSTGVLKKCQDYCRNKKSKFVTKYLELILNFLQGEHSVIVSCNQENSKKLVSQQYERCKKYSILKNLQYCLDNRSPQVKRLLFQVAYMLIVLYFQQISLENEYFYLTLAEQIKKVQKLQLNIVIWLSNYILVLIKSLHHEGKLYKTQQMNQSIIKFVETTQLFERINYMLKNFDKCTQLISNCLDILAYLQEYQIGELSTALQKVDVLSTIESLECQSPECSQKRKILIEYLSQNANIIREL